ncbi:NADase-type glycan-binding domain-containing protein [Streptomyces millisiae]|uniref:Zinc-ribbon domain-containing protein n=1 Tax=Streptomyces millisiae TaxID=3075542 RepID=A0ABU2LP62_9ACTN|nr:hypothetical protein [Streptomyces sp. DSM 44918]MDT0319374.1 hypothetical protein [Streptomyces sp. DSM 44918]
MTCPDCGHRNAAGARFCASCQAFLEWEEPAAGDERPAPEPVPVPEPDPAPVGLRRPGDPDGEVEDGPEHGPGEPPAPAPTPPPAADAADAPTTNCPHCRAANPLDRTLCRRCGVPLAAPDRPPASPGPAGRLPWWRRLFGRRSRQDRLAAGSRPEHRARRRVPWWPVLLVVLAVAAWLGRDQLVGLFDDVRDRTSDPEALHPDEAGASSEAPDHPAGAAFDGLDNRYWAPAEPGQAAGEYLQARFAEAVNLRSLIVTPGSSANRDEFIDQARPAVIALTIVDADGGETREEIDLRDEPGPQTFEVSASDVVSVTLTVEAGYGEDADHHLAVAEVEFFGRH